MIIWWPLGVSALGILLLTVWMIVDSSFPLVADVALIKLHMGSDSGIPLGKVSDIGGVWARLAVLGGLLGVIVTSFALATYLAVATKQGTGLKGLLVHCAVACAMVFVLSQWNAICWWGFQTRIYLRTDSLVEACKSILEKWPIAATMRTPIGVISATDEISDSSLIDLSGDNCTFRDRFGPLVFRRGARVVIDCQSYPSWKIEYSATGQPPTAFIADYGQIKVRYVPKEITRLSPVLFRSRYEETAVGAE